MMVPQKSTSLVVGVGPDVEHAGESCDYCSWPRPVVTENSTLITAKTRWLGGGQLD